jgi:L-aspartate oxidase
VARYGLVVVGAGIAGLYAALTAAEHTDVVVLCRGELASSNSFWAQGGVAAALADDDDPSLHAEDTLRTGRGICSPRAVEVLTQDAPARIAHLVELGVEFDEGLGREGGHSRRRIVHAGGAQTGRRIAEVLVARALAHPRITVREGQRVLAAWIEDERCVGVLTEHGGVRADATLIATGGYAALWEPTTNPLGAVGEGIVLAYRAGAELADLEFVQFHPTAVTGSGFLLSEALRGEGAVLRDDRGERFVDELAERDVVARAIAERGHVGLDLRAIERGRFPSLMAVLERDGYDPAAAPIPVSPAAHYSIGGIVTDTDGRTSVPGLYAAGECTCTGVHGANRLASNSLLECLVFGRRAALAALGEPEHAGDDEAPPVPLDAEREVVTEALRRSMWEHAGLIRSADELEPLREEPLLLSRLLAESALARRESRGAHFRSDYPLADDAFAGHTVQRLGSEPRIEQWP